MADLPGVRQRIGGDLIAFLVVLGFDRFDNCGVEEVEFELC